MLGVEKAERFFAWLQVILFGSLARGDHLKDSDHDIMIVSRSFEGLNFRNRIIEVYSLVVEPLNIEVICLTPEEFKARKDELSIVRVAAGGARALLKFIE